MKISEKIWFKVIFKQPAIFLKNSTTVKWLDLARQAVHRSNWKQQTLSSIKNACSQFFKWSQSFAGQFRVCTRSQVLQSTENPLVSSEGGPRKSAMKSKLVATGETDIPRSRLLTKYRGKLYEFVETLSLRGKDFDRKSEYLNSNSFLLRLIQPQLH